MHYRIIQPCEELREFVSYFWISRWEESDVKDPSIYYSTADSFTKMVFAFGAGLKQTEALFSGVQGQTKTPGQFSTENFMEMIGVSFFPYAIPLLFKMPPNELNGQMLDLALLLGNEAEMLVEKLSGMADSKHRVVFLSSYLKSKLSNHQIQDRSIAQAMQHMRRLKGIVDIAGFSTDYCLSQKQFERRFLSYSGFMPKLYARIVRFENFLGNHSRYNSLTEAAHASGFYDQSHLIHDFRKFSGFSPRDFFKRVRY